MRRLLRDEAGDAVRRAPAGWAVVTDAGVGFIVDAMQNSVEAENLKFHALGTGSTAEAASGAGARPMAQLAWQFAQRA